MEENNIIHSYTSKSTTHSQFHLVCQKLKLLQGGKNSLVEVYSILYKSKMNRGLQQNLTLLCNTARREQVKLFEATCVEDE